VRFAPLVLSVAASWFVWRAGALILHNERGGAQAGLLFNLTLMTAVETMAATPDAPLIACSAAFLWALAKLDDTQDGRWWLAVGAAAGLALLSKYTAFFLGAGAFVWIVLVPGARRWLLSLWTWLGLILALAIFAPNLAWNVRHDWMTFAFQFGRVGTGHFTLRFLVEFLGAQLVLATPFIFLCGAFGLSRATDKSGLLLMTVLPAAFYFAIHSLHDRVQGNWPCFLYSALAVAAAGAMQRTDWKGWQFGVMTWSWRLAVPVASVLLLLCYLQATAGVLPIGRKDPFARLLAAGFADVARRAEASHPAAVLTTDYETAAWFAFYGTAPVVQLNDEQRWLTSPQASASLLDGNLIYIVPQSRDRRALLASRFRAVAQLTPIERVGHGQVIERYDVYRVGGLRGGPFGRMP